MTSTCCDLSESKIDSASSTATELTEMLPRWICVSERTSLATLNAFWNVLFNCAAVAFSAWASL